MSSSKERTKKLSPKAQQIIDIVVTSVEALVVVFCIVISVMVWVGVSDPSDRSFNWFAIQTDSMMGDKDDCVNPGDLMFTKRVNSIKDLHVDQVVAFKDSVKDSKGNLVENQIVTHRITKIENGLIWTKGDNAAGSDYYSKTFDQIIGVYVDKWEGVGKVTLWLGGYDVVITDKARFEDPNQLGGYGYERTGSTTTFLVIIIPLALLFIYNGYVVFKWVMTERTKKIKEAALAEAQAGAAANVADEAAIKRAALVEFMKGQGMTDEQIESYFAQQSTQGETIDAFDADAEPEQVAEVADSAQAPVETEDKPE